MCNGRFYSKFTIPARKLDTDGLTDWGLGRGSSPKTPPKERPEIAGGDECGAGTPVTSVSLPRFPVTAMIQAESKKKVGSSHLEVEAENSTPCVMRDSWMTSSTV